jgi:hypothetical protein
MLITSTKRYATVSPMPVTSELQAGIRETVRCSLSHLLGRKMRREFYVYVSHCLRLAGSTGPRLSVSRFPRLCAAERRLPIPFGK